MSSTSDTYSRVDYSKFDHTVEERGQRSEILYIMADIAMLVAEEYERRVKSSRMAGELEGSTDLASCVSVLAQTLQEKIGKGKMEFLVKWIKEEPRSQIGLEASHGFFSA